MKHSTTKTAVMLALATAGVSGFSTFVAKIGVTAMKDPIAYTFLKNAIVALALVGVVSLFRSWREVRALTRAQAVRLLAIGLVGGSVPFALFFTGIAQTSALNANLIHKTLFVWVAFAALPLFGEKLTRWQWLGAALVLGANVLVGGFQGFRFNAGELMVLGATLLWAAETLIAKRVLADVSPTLLATARMGIGSVVLGGFLAFTGRFPVFTGLTAAHWGWTLLSAALLLAYVSLWYRALAAGPAVVVSALLVPATLITNVLSAAFITHAFGFGDIARACALACGAALIAWPLMARASAGESVSTTPSRA